MEVGSIEFVWFCNRNRRGPRAVPCVSDRGPRAVPLPSSSNSNRGDRVLVASSLSPTGLTGATVFAGLFCACWSVHSSVLMGSCLFFGWALVECCIWVCWLFGFGSVSIDAGGHAQFARCLMAEDT